MRAPCGDSSPRCTASSRSFLRQRAPIGEIIAELSGIRALRVTAQLIDAETDSHLWAEKYSGGMEDVCAIQEEISRKIVSALQVQLTDAESRVVAQRPIDDPAAYDCYLRAQRKRSTWAQHEIYRFTTPDALDRAQKLVDAGLAIIGENALLLATKGLVAWAYGDPSVADVVARLAS